MHMTFASTLLKTLIASAAFAAVSAQALPIVTNGTALGKHGDVKVAVTFDNNKIQKIEVGRPRASSIGSRISATDCPGAETPGTSP